MVAVERPEMTLVRMLDQPRVGEQPRGEMRRREVFHAGEVREIEGEPDQTPRRLRVAFGDLVGFLRRLRARVAVHLERDHQPAEPFRLAFQPPPVLHRDRGRRVVVGELNVDVPRPALFLRAQQSGEFVRIAGRNVAEQMLQPVSVGKPVVFRCQPGGESVETGGGNRADLALKRPFPSPGGMAHQRPETGNVGDGHSAGGGGAPGSLREQRSGRRIQVDPGVGMAPAGWTKAPGW